ncbi:hypothetical protein LEP1GSC047_3010 [Leptospira inadai serovar Lyme str. 10]|uniref:Lipoprotein n=2 Tax=Leptospira inadai serovar Lyme TaxID=293084 RepID=V6HAN1_9LEPT|nr:hypothetical protein [Leptospira inadai]EQA36287.1 hypothetical protein LEP1GSC047_3010 [Leptospira inadai serovar Lyme str. 10]PNV75515.1 hypothetical protein BES34_007695 [Leptospira inadai serovar Lyme]
MKFLKLAIFALAASFSVNCHSHQEDTSSLLLALAGAQTGDGKNSIVIFDTTDGISFTGKCYDSFTVGGASGVSGPAISPTAYFNIALGGTAANNDFHKQNTSSSTCAAGTTNLGFTGGGVPAIGSSFAFKAYYCDPNYSACKSAQWKAAGF